MSTTRLLALSSLASLTVLAIALATGLPQAVPAFDDLPEPPLGALLFALVCALVLMAERAPRAAVPMAPCPSPGPLSD